MVKMPASQKGKKKERGHSFEKKKGTVRDRNRLETSDSSFILRRACKPDSVLARSFYHLSDAAYPPARTSRP